ncbi:putative RNA-directed DNA polymerase, eukaryota, reverse transcriptase zinc-binding domain protein [Tanacetum coccineum]
MSTSNISTNSNQQTLADSGANERPPMLEKGNYIPWESRFRRFLDNKLEDGERMWNSIQNVPYQRPMVVDPTNTTVPILEPLSKMTEGNKKQYIADVRVMNYLLQVSTPLKINDYRPISCCNVIYKCISKILTNRIIDGIKEVVSDNQSAFVPGRRISDNILITQELMHNYHRNRGPPRCAFKIDIQKAYDTVDWRFLGCVLKYFGFHPLMIKWIMACVTSTSFSLNINGDIHGFFKGKRGLRQGDPLSPYLFTLIMEVLTLMIKRRVNLSGVFRYHKNCEELQLVNVCFADDLFIFARGDLDSARVIMESLDDRANLQKLQLIKDKLVVSIRLIIQKVEGCSEASSPLDAPYSSDLGHPIITASNLQSLDRWIKCHASIANHNAGDCQRG